MNGGLFVLYKTVIKGDKAALWQAIKQAWQGF